MNPLRRLIVGSGLLPDDLRAALSAEGIVLIEEGLPGSVTYRNYRAPGRYSNWRKVAFSGAIAITTRRLVVAAARGGKQVDVPLVPDSRRAVQVSSDKPDTVLFTIDPHVFDPQKSGTIEIRLRTPRAAEIVARLNR